MRIVVCHSGGLDSSVCLLMGLEAAHEVISLGFDYDQRAKIELDYAKRLCRRFDVPRRVLQISWKRHHRKIPRGRSIGDIRARPSTAFLPARNAILLCLALAEAIALEADEVWTGLNYRDSPGYPDCQPTFLNAMQRLASAAVPGGPSVCAPLMEFTKPQIAERAMLYGLVSADTWSCYRPRRVSSRVTPCGRCDGCVVHQHAWERVGEIGRHA